MPGKSKLLFGNEARDKMMVGVRMLANAVTETLGPRGRNCAIARSDPHGNVYQRVVLHDGVSVARAIDLDDEYENMGAQILKEAAIKQVMDVGDGTTAVIMLAKSIIEEANVLIAAGVNPMELRKGIEKSVEILIKEIEKVSIPVKTYEQKKAIATVSSEDPELGELVARVVDDMGIEGQIVVEASKESRTTVEKQEGMQIDKGFMSPYFMTNPDRGEAVKQDAYILVTDITIPVLGAIKSIIEECAANGHQLVLITPSVGQDALGALVENKLKGVLNSLAISAPSFGKYQKDILQDIAILTGARFVTSDAGHKLDEITMQDLGRAEFVTSTKGETIIVGGKGELKQIKLRIAELKNHIKSVEETEDDFELAKVRERLAKLTSGVTVIHVGGTTEIEMNERLERVKDAVEATKAAVRSGIVPGGEVIYLQAREKLDQKDMVQNLMYKALYQPFKKLLNNAGLNDGAYYEKLQNQTAKFVFTKSSDLTKKQLERLSDPSADLMIDFSPKFKKIGTLNAGVDVTTGEIKDMVVVGLVDPSLVSIKALTNAASVSIQLITTQVIIVPDIKKDTNAVPVM